MKRTKIQGLFTKTFLMTMGVITTVFLIGLVGYLIAGNSSTKTSVSSDKGITVTGRFVCLPHKDPSQATEECAFGIKSDGGKYYALHQPESKNSLGSFSKFSAGQRMRITGEYQQKQDAIYKSIGIITVDSTEYLDTP